jgi:hypothetical protein
MRLQWNNGVRGHRNKVKKPQRRRRPYSEGTAIRELARIVGQRHLFGGCWLDKEFESTPGSVKSGANPEETSEMPVMKSTG